MVETLRLVVLLATCTDADEEESRVVVAILATRRSGGWWWNGGGGTGVVGTIKNGNSKRAISLHGVCSNVDARRERWTHDERGMRVGGFVDRNRRALVRHDDEIDVDNVRRCACQKQDTALRRGYQKRTDALTFVKAP